MPTSPITKVNEYAAAVRSGALPSCLMVRKAVDRWYEDMARPDLYFDRSAFIHVVKFSAMLKHFKGEFAGQPIHWEPWQLFILANIFGLKYRATKRRKYTYADVYVPRKNGKTTFAAVIALYMLLLDGESAAEVYAAAVDKAQAKICFDASAELVKGVPELEGYVRVFRKGSIVVEDTASAYKPLSKDTKNKDGLNIHCGICDERHAWKTNEIYEVLKTGVGARSQPLIFSISTAGTDTTYPYFRDLEFLRQVMLGIKEKDNHFIMLYEPDEGDAWDDPATWAKVNPNFGVSLGRKYMEDECQEAKEKGGSTLAAFQTKNLNMWVDAPEVWIPDDDVAACSSAFDESQLEGAECYVGIDLASKSDLTAAAFWFPKFGVVRYLFTVPESKLTEDQGRGDVVDYRLWVEQGWLTVCPGRVLDEEWWLQQLFKAMAPYKVKCIAYDPWGMWDLKNRFGKYEDALMEYRQDIRYMSVPTKDLESRVLKHGVNLLGNPVIRWMFRNVVIYKDPNANIKLDKARSRNKIDGVVATVDAIGGWLNKTSEQGNREIYTDMKFHTVPRI
jgi:phage terminase large subunit-like protein